MASRRGKVKAVTDFIFLGSKTTVTMTTAIFARKAVTKLDSVLKTRDITLPTEIKAMVFPVVVYGCES